MTGHELVEIISESGADDYEVVVYAGGERNVPVGRCPIMRCFVNHPHRRIVLVKGFAE